MVDLTEQKTQTWSDTSQYIVPNVLQMRLDTSEIMNSMLKFLSGEIMLPETQPNGSTKFVTQQIGEKICNKKGTQQLVNYTQGIINSAVVQGNYTPEQYINHVGRIHRSLARQLLANYADWDMKYEDLELTMDFIMNLVEPFLSRLIHNKERESYDKSLRVAENSRVEAKKGWMPMGGA